MTTYTVQAYSVLYDDITDEPISFELVDFSVVFPDGQTTFTYTIDQSFPGELPEVNITGGRNPRVDGVLIDEDFTIDIIGEVTSANPNPILPDLEHILYVIEDEVTGGDIIIQLGGDPLPTITNLAEFIDFLDNDLTGERELGPAEAFGPGQPISVPAVPGVSISENDNIVGDDTSESLDGGAGNDTVSGEDGDDTVLGGIGGDTLYGGDGDDIIYGGDGADTIYGGEDDDEIRAGAGNDLIFAGDTNGFEIIRTGGGNDTVDFSGAGASDFYSVDYRFLSDGINANLGASTGTVVTSVGTDTLTSLATLDETNGGLLLRGSTGDDTITVNLGTDEFIIIRGEAGDDSITGGAGFDRLDYRSSGSGVTANIGTGTVSDDGLGGSDTFSNIDEFRGSDFADSIIGSSGNDRIITRLGDDSVDGGAGTDLVRYDRMGVTGVTVDLEENTVTGTWDGQSFTDSLFNIENIRGSNSADTITGDGNDNLLLGRGGDDLIEGGGGADTINGEAGTDIADYSDSFGGVNVFIDNATPNSGGDAAGDLLFNIEGLIGSDFNDNLVGDGGVNTLFGRDGNDVLAGFGGADSLSGGAGFDILFGVDGGTTDTLNGGADRDIAYYLDATSGLVVDMADNTNLANNSGEHTDDVWIDIEGVFGASGFSNTITGDSRQNDMVGGNQSDVISGGDAIDVLVGLGGGDTLIGGNGNDVLLGGAGTDTLTGEAGADVYYIQTGNAIDIITDWSEADDFFLFFQTGVSSFAELTFTQAGSDVEITSTADTTFTVVVQGAVTTDLDDSANYLFL